MKNALVRFLTLLISLFACIFTFEISLNGTRALEQATFYEKTNSDLIVFHNDDSIHDNDFYYLNDLYSIKTSERLLRTDILMLKNNNQYYILGKNIDLKSNEAIISNNLLKEASSDDNPLFLVDDMNGNKQELKIKETIQPIYGISLDYLSPNVGLIILGYDESVASTTKESVVFASSEVQLNDMLITNSLNVSDLIRKYKNSSDLLGILLVSINFIILLFISIALNLLNLPLIKRNIKEGLSYFKIINKYTVPKVILSFAYSIIFIILNLIYLVSFHGYYLFNLINLLYLVVLLILFALDMVFVRILLRKV